MKTRKFTLPAAVIAVAVALGIFGLSPATYAAPGSGVGVGQDAAERRPGKLNKSQFKDVKVCVDNGIATLTGTVSLYEYKKDAAQSRA